MIVHMVHTFIYLELKWGRINIHSGSFEVANTVNTFRDVTQNFRRVHTNSYK